MRVLYLSPYPPARDGIGSYACLLAHAVKGAGNEIAVISPRRMPNAPAEVIGSAFDSRFRSVRLSAEIERWNPDVIHVQFAVAAFGNRTLSFLRWLRQFHQACQIPVVVTLHEVTRESALLPIASRVMFRRIAAQSEHLIVHTGVAFTTLTEKHGVSASSVSVIPHPRGEPSEPTSTPGDLRARFELGDTRVLLAFGFIHVDKGLDDLVQALGIIRRTRRALLENVRLVVAGQVRHRRGVFRVFEARDHLHLARTLHLIRYYDLQDFVVRTGYVPAGEVASWFQVADAVVLPYRRIEQSGVASLARSFRATVLPSMVGGLAELYAGSQWGFPARAPDHLAETIVRFLDTNPSDGAQRGSVPGADDLGSVTSRTLQVYRAVAVGN